MPDAFGLVQAPMAVPDVGFAAGDELITTLLTYLQAFLNDNATTAWQTVAPNTKPVESVQAAEPPLAFTEKLLPALFGYRGGETKEDWIGDGVLVSTSDVTILWVMRITTQDNQKKRIAFRNAIGKLVNMGIERGRTPSFVIASQTVPTNPDYDPIAATQGSLLYPLLGAWSLNYRKSRPRAFVDARPTKVDQQPFDALEMTLELCEDQTYGLDRYTTIDGVDVKVMNADGSELLVEGQEDTP